MKFPVSVVEASFYPELRRDYAKQRKFEWVNEGEPWYA
jgi:hypothetical protein